MALQVKGASDVIKELRKYGKDIETRINDETEAIAFQIEADAKKRAPKNFGKLAQSISKSKVSESNYKVTVNEDYGGYMEFGTGVKVNVPMEFKDLAAAFKNNKKAAYPILAKILGAGVNPQPFLYPAWVKGKKDYLKNLNKLLNKK